MNPHKEWFYEYERYDGGDVFQDDDSVAKIIGGGTFKLNLMDGRIRTLPVLLDIPRFARNLIYVSKMDDVGVKIVFDKESYEMVRGAMVLLKGVQFRSLHKLQGSTISDGCNSSIVPNIGVEEKELLQSMEKILCCGIKY